VHQNGPFKKDCCNFKHLFFTPLFCQIGPSILLGVPSLKFVLAKKANLAARWLVGFKVDRLKNFQPDTAKQHKLK
jgi:hypothetical protein